MQINHESQQSLWVFGYGSLIWNPGFNFDESFRAYALGFARRMYQGNTFHRGDDKLPGRVATLIQNANSSTNGLVFRVDGEAQIRTALAHLKERELDNGYEFCMVPLEVELNNGFDQVMALTCIAKLDNEFYLGPDDVEKMACDICIAKGRAGPNFEYVLKLAENVRRLFPEDEDDHLFELEVHIRQTQATLAF